MFTQNANKIFAQAIDDYHRYDDVDHQLSNPYAEGTIDHLLYMKNWVDTVQWHLEDIIRDPRIDPVEALKIKRRIDKSNQVRTDMVEYIDSYLLDKYKNIDVQPGARINTETPAWAIDRLSILALTCVRRGSARMWTRRIALPASKNSMCCCRSRLIFRLRSRS